MRLFRRNARQWNERVFGNIFDRKFRCMARLVGIQRALSSRKSTYLENFEIQVCHELNEALSQEELFMASKIQDLMVTGRGTLYPILPSFGVK